MATVEPAEARRLWMLFEPVHAVVYFAPEAGAMFKSIGLRGFWMGYFASRSAPMGLVPPAVVVATFYGFHPRVVERALPDAWTRTSADTVLHTREEIADAALRRLLGDWVDSDAATEAAELARRAAERCDVAGRPLFAAHASLPWPSSPHLALWHAATRLREHRGDGHVASLVAAGLDGCEAQVSVAALGDVPAETLRTTRGWTEAEWADAENRLTHRDLLERPGVLTAEGRAQRSDLEATTDALALGPWQALGAEAAERLAALLAAPVGRINAAGGVPYPNPIALPAAAAGGR